MGEFELIQHYFASATCAVKKQEMVLGIGDDCALLALPPHMELAVSTDTLVADVHFPSTGDPFLIGQRALAVTASDLAAMGATPVAFTLALTLPEVDQSWLKAFSSGLSQKALEVGLSLVGGDTTKGPLSLTLTVLGKVPCGAALRRSGAQVGDLLCVSGFLGQAAGALPMVLGHKEINTLLLDDYWSPTPQVALGQALRGVATACLDISDGLVADCGHIAKASQVALMIDVEKLPCSARLQHSYSLTECRQLMLTGGDDYQLAFTVSPQQFVSLKVQWPNIFVIGYVAVGEGVSVELNNQPFLLDKAGYEHF